MNDHEMMVISALRYALPRGSYIMQFTDEYISKMLKPILKPSKNFLHVAIKDIEQFIRENPEYTRYNWRPLLDRLKQANA